MKLEIQRADFLKAWQLALKTAGTKTTKDSLNCIFIRASEDGITTLEATDLKTSVKAKAQGVSIQEPGEAVIPVAVLGEMLKKIKADTITLEVSSGRGTLNADKSRSRFPIMPVEEFPKIPSSSDGEAVCEIMASDLAKLINEGSAAASQPADFPKYLGTCLLRTSDGYLKAVSTDGKRLSLSKLICTVTKNEDLLLPSPALKDLAKNLTGDSTARILADGSTVWFILDDTEFSIRRIESSFPNYERILNSEVQTTMKTSCSTLSSALERIDLIAKTTPAHIMAMILTPGDELRITARAPELGTTSENLEAVIEGSTMTIGFNSGYFYDGLKALGEGDVLIEFSGEEGQTRMFRDKSEDFLYMLMPARLSPQDVADDYDEEITPEVQETEPAGDL